MYNLDLLELSINWLKQTITKCDIFILLIYCRDSRQIREKLILRIDIFPNILAHSCEHFKVMRFSAFVANSPL